MLRGDRVTSMHMLSEQPAYAAPQPSQNAHFINEVKLLSSFVKLNSVKHLIFVTDKSKLNNYVFVNNILKYN